MAQTHTQLTRPFATSPGGGRGPRRRLADGLAAGAGPLRRLGALAAALSLLWALTAAPAQAQSAPKANDYRVSSFHCTALRVSNTYNCTVFFHRSFSQSALLEPIEGMPVFVAVTQQRLVGDKGADGEAYTTVAKPETMTFGTGADNGGWKTDSSGGFSFQMPIKVMTCIKDLAEADDERVSTDGAGDGSSAEGMRCKNKHMKLRNARYHITWFADACFNTCPPSYTVRVVNGMAINDFTLGRNKNLPHQLRLGGDWVPYFRNPHFGKP